jgi:hypothetical protein
LKIENFEFQIAEAEAGSANFKFSIFNWQFSISRVGAMRQLNNAAQPAKSD